MKFIVSIFIILFSIQLSIKTIVLVAYETIWKKDKMENCEYKSMTVCEGSCYVVKQIKIITNEKTSKPFSIPLDIIFQLEEMIAEKFIAVSVSTPVFKIIDTVFSEYHAIVLNGYKIKFIHPPNLSLSALV